MLPAIVHHLSNIDKRNQLIRGAFYKRYTQVPRASKPDPGLVVAKLAEKYFLSVKNVEKVLWVPR